MRVQSTLRRAVMCGLCCGQWGTGAPSGFDSDGTRQQPGLRIAYISLATNAREAESLKPKPDALAACKDTSNQTKSAQIDTTSF